MHKHKAKKKTFFKEQKHNGDQTNNAVLFLFLVSVESQAIPQITQKSSPKLVTE